MFQQMTYIDACIIFISLTCRTHNATTTIDRYQRTNWPIPIVYKTADTDCRPIIGASLISGHHQAKSLQQATKELQLN